MSEDLIRRSDAIEAIEVVDWYHQNRNKDMVSGANSDEHQAWYKADDVYKALKAVPSTDIPSKVVAQITFDEEKLREIVKKAVERFKEEYEIADIPTVIRVKSILKKEDYESLADSIRQQDQNVIVIPHNAELVTTNAELVTTAGRPQGEWIGEADGYYNGELVYDTWYCSNCDYVVDDEEPPTWNYCPNCGADMKGVDDGSR